MRFRNIGISIKGETYDFDKAMQKVKESLKDLDVNIKKTGRALASNAASFAKWGGAIAAASGVAAAAIAKSSLSNIKELRNLAGVAGLSVAEFERMAFAAQSFGIEQDKLADIIKDSADKFGDFFQNNAGPLKDFFTNIAPQVGITADAFRNLNARDALQLYVSSLEKANLNQNDMTFYMEAIASDATMLLPLLRDNAKEMRELEQAAKDLGIGLSEVDVENAIEAQQKLEQLGKVIDGMVNQAVADLAPLIAEVVQEILNMIKEAGGIEAVVAKGMREVADAIESAQTVLQFFEDAWTGVKIAALTVTTAITGALAVIEKSVITIVNLFRDMFGKLTEWAADGLSFFDEETAKTMRNVSDSIKNTVDHSKGFFQELAESQYDALSGMTKALANQASSVLGMIKRGLQWIGKQVEENAKKIKETGGDEPENKPPQTDSVYVPADAYGDFGASYVDSLPELDEEKYRSQLELMREIDQEHWKTTEMGNLEHLMKMQDQLNTALGNDAAARKQYADLALDIENAKQDALKSMAIDTFETVLAFAAQNSEKAFKLQQAYGIAETIISTAKAIMKAYDMLGPIGGTIAAIKIAALGAMKIQQIRAARPGSGGGGGVGGISGGAGNNGGGAQQPQEPQGPNRIFNVDLTGSSSISSQQARNLLEVINEQAGDGVEINIRGATGG